MHHRPLAFAVACLGALCNAGAHAAAPAATTLTPGYSFSEYAGVTPVGVGAVKTNGTLYYIDEKTLGGVKSWYVFYEGDGLSSVSATLRFDAPIVDVFATRSSLSGSDNFASDAVTYVYRPLTGLETRHGDSVSFQQGSRSLQLSFSTLSPGDHIRVLTAVPEPTTPPLMAAGLATLWWLSRRRRG